MIITQGILKRTDFGTYKPSLLFRVNGNYNHIWDFIDSNSISSLVYTNSIDERVEDKGEGIIFKDPLGNHFIFWIEDAYVE